MSWRKWPPWQKRVQQQPRSDRVKRKGDRGKNILAAINSIAHELETNRQEQSATDTKKDSRDKWTIRGLFVTAGIALLALVLGIYQTSDARHSFEADHRAWLAPQHAGSKPLVAATPLELSIQIFNTGRQPATDVTSYVGWLSFPGTDIEDVKMIESLDDLSIKCPAMPQTRNGVMYPSTGNSSYSIATKIPDDIIDPRIVRGDAILAVYGCMAYRTFEAVHHSNFCFFYEAEKTAADSWGFCTVGNYAD